MSMRYKDFIALAQAIIEHNRVARTNGKRTAFTHDQLVTIAVVCHHSNPAFKVELWLSQIESEMPF